MIVARNLTCGYHKSAVLHNLSFSIAAGEAIALIGPNGSGKSTLLKTLCGVLKSLSGKLLIGGKDIREYNAKSLASRVSTVPQEEPVSFGFSVREVVTMGRLARSSGILDSPEDRVLAIEAMKLADCYELADRPFPELSGGERQRALIARAFAQDCDVLLMDEPTSHLDVPHQLSTANLIRNISSEGKTVVAAVHDLNLASLFATRVILLEGDSIVADGETEAVLESSALETAFRARFQRIRLPSGRLVLVPIGNN